MWFIICVSDEYVSLSGINDKTSGYVNEAFTFG